MHYFGIVMTDDGNIEKALAPFSEHLEVEPYERECWCDGKIENCETCGGTNKTTTTSNPKGEWDWYEVGGRWEGALLDGRNIGLLWELREKEDVSAFFVLTPDGVWLKRDNWRDGTRKDAETWKQEIREIINDGRWSDGIVVCGVDIHS